MYILQGLADAIALLIVLALLWNANSSGNIASYVPHLEALGLADSPVIEPVQSGLVILIYAILSFLLNHCDSIQIGRLFIINLAFSNNDFISHNLSTSSCFCDNARYLWL